MTEHETPTADKRAIHWCESRGASLATLALHERGQCCSECASVAAAIREAVAAEREACAEIAHVKFRASGGNDRSYDGGYDDACAEIEVAIRDRGTP